MKKIVDGIYRILCWIIVLFMGAMTVMVFVNTALRYLTSTSIIASEEISRFLFVWCIFIGGIVALADDIHIKVELLTERLPAVAQKGLLVVVYAAILAISVIIACGGWSQTVLNLRNYAPATDIPLAVQNVSAFICGIGMALISLARLIQTFQPGQHGNESRDGVKKEGSL